MEYLSEKEILDICEDQEFFVDKFVNFEKFQEICETRIYARSYEDEGIVSEYWDLHVRCGQIGVWSTCLIEQDTLTSASIINFQKKCYQHHYANYKMSKNDIKEFGIKLKNPTEYQKLYLKTWGTNIIPRCMLDYINYMEGEYILKLR